jgi:hypothetical protein
MTSLIACNNTTIKNSTPRPLAGVKRNFYVSKIYRKACPFDGYLYPDITAGGISLTTLPITKFPDIAPPTVQVTAVYPGANAEVVARAVATPIEEAVNGVENMTYMTSSSNNDGTMALNVYFKQGTDPDIAAVNVQNRVSKAVSQIPQEVVQAGISTQKQQNSIIMFVALIEFEDTTYDETFLLNYIKINLVPQTAAYTRGRTGTAIRNARLFDADLAET